MLIWLIVLFVVIWIVVIAFSSNEKEVHVTKIDPNTGGKTVEIRKEVGGSAGKTAAKVTLWIFIGIPLILIFIAVSLSLAGCTSSQNYLRGKFESHSNLKDPGSVEFRNLTYNVFVGDQTWCGEVNAKNSYGGYVGWAPFVLTVTKDGGVTIHIKQQEAYSENTSNSSLANTMRDLDEALWNARAVGCGKSAAPSWVQCGSDAQQIAAADRHPATRAAGG